MSVLTTFIVKKLQTWTRTEIWKRRTETEPGVLNRGQPIFRLTVAALTVTEHIVF